MIRVILFFPVRSCLVFRKTSFSPTRCPSFTCSFLSSFPPPPQQKYGNLKNHRGVTLRIGLASPFDRHFFHLISFSAHRPDNIFPNHRAFARLQTSFLGCPGSLSYPLFAFLPVFCPLFPTSFLLRQMVRVPLAKLLN